MNLREAYKAGELTTENLAKLNEQPKPKDKAAAKTPQLTEVKQQNSVDDNPSLQASQNSVLAIHSLKAWVKRHRRNKDVKKQVQVVEVAPDTHPEGEEAVVVAPARRGGGIKNSDLAHVVASGNAAQSRRWNLRR